MIVRKNVDGTVSILINGMCLTSEGSVATYKRIYAKSMIIDNAHLVIDTFRGDVIKVIGDATLEIETIGGRNNPAIDTSEASKYASVTIGGVKLNLNKRNDIFNKPVVTKRRPVHSRTADIDDGAIRPIDEDVAEIIDQFV